LAKEVGARITVLYVKRPYLAPYYGDPIALELPLPSELEEIAEKEARTILDAAEKICFKSGVNCTRLTVSNDVVYQSIIEAATTNDCDLICMASHGRRGFDALLLGSETHKVLTHSKIPVLVFR
jgi:nucleotide-binding universal stress UspA family protein